MDIIIEDRVSIIEKVRAVLKGGHILAVYRECDSLFAENYLKELVREYRITKKVFPSNIENTEENVDDMRSVPDDVRLVLAFGGRNLLELAKDTATMLGIPLIIMLTEPITVDGMRTYIFRNGELDIRRSVEPSLILVDSNYLSAKQDFRTCVDTIAKSLLYAVDGVISNVLSGKGIGDTTTLDDILERGASISENDKMDILSKAYKVANKGEDIIRQMTLILSHNGIDEKCSNSEFIYAYTILLMYQSYLRMGHNDVIYPPDIMESVMRLHRHYNMDVGSAVLDYKMISSREYMRSLHMLDEYRDDLMPHVDRSVNVMRCMAKVYRRVSKDAGFDIFNDIDLRDIMQEISLFAVTDNRQSVLKLMKIGGYLERYIDMKAS